MGITRPIDPPAANGAVLELVSYTTRDGITVEADDPAAYWVSTAELDADGDVVFSTVGVTAAVAEAEGLNG